MPKNNLQEPQRNRNAIANFVNLIRTSTVVFSVVEHVELWMFIIYGIGSIAYFSVSGVVAFFVYSLWYPTILKLVLFGNRSELTEEFPISPVLLAVVIMTTANGRHSTFSERHRNFFDHFRSYIFYHFRSLPISDEVDRLSTKFTEVQWTSVTLTLILQICRLLNVSSA